MLNPESRHRIIVTGASSVIGHFLLPRLLEAGYEVHAVSRSPAKSATDKKLFWYQADIGNPSQLPRVNVHALIHLAPLWLLPPLLPVLQSRKIKRLIGFGSTSLFSKAGSANAGERQLAARLAAAEEAISRFCVGSDMNWTVFRPTLVYDCIRDKNVMTITRLIRRLGFFPLLGNAAGRRQPVHAGDLADACVLAVERSATFNKAYNLSGGETLSYRQMVEKIFGALGRPVRFLVIPAWLFRLAIHVVMLLPGKQGITPEMATRMNADLCFNHDEATRDFGFSPRPFKPLWEDSSPR